MTDHQRKRIEIPEIVRIEGHAAVNVDISDGKVADVQLEVFEGTRLFERIVLGHHFSEIPHITSRVCAICSTGHVLAAILTLESILDFECSEQSRLLRELIHLGMIIESHATHIFALALPDFLGAKDLIDFATNHQEQFTAWTHLRTLGSNIQTAIGGRPFHPVNLQVGGLSHYPDHQNLQNLKAQIEHNRRLALNVADFLLKIEPSFKRSTSPSFVALIPDGQDYGYFGRTVRCTDGWEESITNYRHYLNEQVVPYSHAKRATAKGKDMMVGSMSRLLLFGERLKGQAAEIFKSSPIAQGDTNTIWNNLAQSIEVVQAIDRAIEIVDKLADVETHGPKPIFDWNGNVAQGVGAVECPRGTLYHSYELDSEGTIIKADMITPSVQNCGRIELDIREIVEASTDHGEQLQSNLETLVRAYDPCNTCATHMVKVSYKGKRH